MTEEIREERGPPRPLLAAALAVLAGSWTAGLWPVGAVPARWLVLGLVAAGTLGAALARTRTTLGRSGGVGVLALGLLAGLALAWALPPLSPRSQRSTGPHAPDRADPVAEDFEGRWFPRSKHGQAAYGSLAGSAGRRLELELPAGIALEGETLRVLATVGAAPVEPTGRGDVRRVRADEVLRLERAPGSSWSRRGRARLIERSTRLRSQLARELTRVLVCGDTSRLDPALGDLFTRTGVRHLLAVSGLHVGLVALLVVWPLARGVSRVLAPHRLRPGDLAGPLIAIAVGCVLILVYAQLAGGSAPVRRASLALALAALGPVLVGRLRRAGRYPDGLSLWSAALLLELTADPAAVRSLAVQLSYAATLGVLLGIGPVMRAAGFGRPPPAGLRSVGWIGTAVRKLLRAFGVGVGTSAAAVLATLPIVWARFGEVSPIGLVATPLALPLVAWLLVSGWALLLAPALVPEAVFSLPAGALVSFLEVCDGLPGTPWPLPERPIALVLAASVAAFLAWRRPRPLPRATALALWGLLLLPWCPSPAGFELVVLDVGHGTCVVLRGPGTGVWVFDCGSRDRPRVAREVLAPVLARWEATRPAVVLSHADTDHASGLPWLIERFPPRSWAGALPAPLGERLPHTCPRLDLDSGRVRWIGGSRSPLEFELARGLAAAGNEGSRCLRIRLGEGPRGPASVVLCGDAEQEGLRALMGSRALEGPLELILMPHHGSDTPWLGDLLARSRPVRAWVSGSGRPAIAAELERRSLDARSTHEAGSLTLDWRPSPPAGPSLGPLAGPLAAPGPPAVTTWHGSRKDVLRTADATRARDLDHGIGQGPSGAPGRVPTRPGGPESEVGGAGQTPTPSPVAPRSPRGPARAGGGEGSARSPGSGTTTRTSSAGPAPAGPSAGGHHLRYWNP